MWRYRELLPISDKKYRVSMGEGFTPLRKRANLGKFTGNPNLFVKDESHRLNTSEGQAVSVTDEELIHYSKVMA